MTLDIATFDNRTGPSSFFKAIGHPFVAARVRAFLDDLGRAGPVTVYDPVGQARDLFALFPPRDWVPQAFFIQRLEDIGANLLGLPARPVSEIGGTPTANVLLCDFDAGRMADDIAHLLPAGAGLVTLDGVRLPEEFLSNRDRYLDPRNFATNFALFRDGEGLWTRLTTANYWAGYGAALPALWFCLFDGEGRELARWRDDLGTAPRTIVVDSRAVRERFALPAFAGSLFLHAVGIAGHDAIKYALDVGSEDGVSSTHDANAYPADLYGGLPAPAAGERVILWLQNAHPTPIPARAVGLSPMGTADIQPIPRAVLGFGTAAIEVGALLPDLPWPRQVEIHAGRHLVRPRYEVLRRRLRAIAHVNVERTDLSPDTGLAERGDAIGQGPLIVAPILPIAGWRTAVLPTPMATMPRTLSLRIRVRAPDGRVAAERPLGPLSRDHAVVVAADELLGPDVSEGYGHVEVGYDFGLEPRVDGWLHALFRYQRRDGDGLADTSFGAHLFNLPVTFRGEPQSYQGRPPGLSTRLFLRLADDLGDTICHLIYPASGAWRPVSATALTLWDAAGQEVARRDVQIAQNGSLRWSVRATFSTVERDRARGGYIVVRDRTCRLFGYHGLEPPSGHGSLDHMFGF
ncbi:MAG: hypothetical protein EXQ94_15110 [Alphaproteobacteria bacterium]|nr:hypothetical protein [Alphaproteobacteria bacterium]